MTMGVKTNRGPISTRESSVARGGGFFEGLMCLGVWSTTSASLADNVVVLGGSDSNI